MLRFAAESPTTHIDFRLGCDRARRPRRIPASSCRVRSLMIHGSTQRRPSAWRPARQYLRRALSAEQRDWKLDPGSLTRRQRQRCGGGCRGAVGSQRWWRPLPDERRLLGMAAAERALIREVHLLCGYTPWVFARTVMPVSSLRGRKRRLTRLGNTPLGAALFAARSLRRGAVEVVRLRPGEELFVRAVAGAAAEVAAIWGRRSVFRLQERPLLVSEIFLPALLQGERSHAVAPPRRGAGAGDK